MFKILRNFLITISFILSTTTSMAAEFNWKYIGVINAKHDYAKIMIAAFKRVEERSGGNLKIDYTSFGETPYKPIDAQTLIRDGLTEMTEWLAGYNAGTYPLLAAPNLPMIAEKWVSPAELQKVKLEAWATPTVSAYKKKIFDDHNAASLSTHFYDPINIWFSEVVTDISDIKGKKVRATQPEQAKWLTAMGASPVNISASDAYQGLQRGVIDGIITGSGAVVGFKWYEVLKSGFAANVLLSSTDIMISKSALESLPEGTRNILVEEMKNVEKSIHEAMPKAYEAKVAELRDKGLVITEPSPELYQQFRQYAVEEVYPDWAKRAGGDAQKSLSEMGITLQ